MVTSQREAPALVATGRALFFSLAVSLIEKGKQRNEQTAKRHQQSRYPDENRNDFISCHKRHLPYYVFRQTGSLVQEATTPVVGSILEYYHSSAGITINYDTILIPLFCCLLSVGCGLPVDDL